LGINPGKLIGPKSATPLASAGGWVGAKPPRHNARPGRTGLAGRGNEFGAAKRWEETEDVISETIGPAIVVAELAPEITSAEVPTYSEFLNAIQAPIGGGEILWSGSEPVSPQNCQLWPDSPLCGGSVVDPGSIGLYGPEPVGLNITVSVNPTETLVQIAPSIFGVNLPPVWLGFRRAGAQEIVDAHWAPGPATTTPVGGESFGGPGADIRWIVFQDSYPGTINRSADFGPEFLDPYENKVFFNIPPIPIWSTNGSLVYRFSYMGRSVGGGFATYLRDKAEGTFSPFTGGPVGGYSVFRGRVTRTMTVIRSTPPVYPPEIGYQLNPDLAPYGFYSGTIRFTRPDGSFTEGFSGANQAAFYPRIAAIPWEPPMAPPPPPALPPRSPALPDGDCMDCCPEVLKLLKKILKTLGADDLPWKLPNNLGSGQGGQTTITNYAKLQIYHFTQLSHMLGQTKIRIKVKDSDLTQEGNQEQILDFDNISEALAEIAGMAITNQAVSAAALKAALTGVIQSGMAFTTAATIDQNLGEIIEWLGFGMQRKTFEVPLAYTPGKSSPDEILQESQANLSYWKLDDKNTLQTHITTLEQAAAIIRAALWERIGSEAQGAQAIKDKVREVADSIGSDFDTFLERTEQGFTDAPGQTDITPYGRPFGERPRIRKIGGGNANDGSNA